MAKFKRGKALFDLLSEEERRGRNPLKVPAWWEKGGPKTPTAVEHPHPVIPPDPPRLVQPQRGETQPTAGRPPLVELDGDRVRFSLTSISAAVVVFVLAVLLLAAFEGGRSIGSKRGFAGGYAAGRASFEAETMDEIEAARLQPPATHVVESLLRDAPPTPAAQTQADAAEPHREPTTPAWIADYTYVVTQEFSAGREDDARAAQEFLAQHGVETALVRYPSGATQLITTRGFRRSEPSQREAADQFLDRIHAIGEKYFSSGGRYRLQGYFKTYKGDNW